MNWKTIFISLKNRDMQKRLLIVLGLIAIYRMLSHIPVPLAGPTELKNHRHKLSERQRVRWFPKPAIGWRYESAFDRTGWAESIYYC